MKIDPVDTEIALLIVKKEEINASKIDSSSASLPSGLNNIRLISQVRTLDNHRLGLHLPQLYTARPKLPHRAANGA